MRPLPISTIALMSAIFFLTACGVTEFSSSTASSNDKVAGASSSSESSTCSDDSESDQNEDGSLECQDEAAGSLPQMTADEAIARIEDLLNGEDPTSANLESILEGELDPLRCYISGGGGHGIDMCMTNTTPVAGLSKRGARGTFIEIKGSQLCVPLQVLIDNQALFKTAVTGECQ